MTPYERTLKEKIAKATDLTNQLAERSNGHTPPELLTLRNLIEELEETNRQFDQTVALYQSLTTTRRAVADGPSDSIRRVTNDLWADAREQFAGGSVTRELVKLLYAKVKSAQLPPFPVYSHKPIRWKDILFFEDSFALLGQHFGWLIGLLRIIGFIPIQPHCALDSLQELAAHYEAFTLSVRTTADRLGTLEASRLDLYSRLRYMSSIAHKRLTARERTQEKVM